MAYSRRFLVGIAYLNFHLLVQVLVLKLLKSMRLSALQLCLFLVFVSGPGVAEELKSFQTSFGVTLYLPDDWQLLSKDDLSSVEGNGKKELDLPPLMRERLAERMQQGDLELLFNTRDSHQGVYDNLSLFETNDQVPEAASQIKATCSALPGLLGRTLGKEVELERCEGKEVQGYPAFILAYAGSVPDTRVLQYMLQIEQRKSLVMTLTYHQEDAMGSLQDFETLLEHLELVAQ
ncbi:hypothetical protein [Marinospirillum sp.]|uniref:hypothetical protein n=1 Tax=Marinospirillum sp. TaxID=2183934 RepID=UPI0028705024|nr:hypothetical protein [Marinospirillum sp.]MDR9468205.1 hypothetical protein [Marinospirillum sp.]